MDLTGDSGDDGPLPPEMKANVWKDTLADKDMTVERAMELADAVPEIDYILSTDDQLWRGWWLRDFELQEQNLLLSARGLPDWILNTRPSGSEQVDYRHAKVPWRRMYMWTVFFQKRLAKYVINLADIEARKFVPSQPKALTGVRVAVYYPTYELKRPYPSSMRILPIVETRTIMPEQIFTESEGDYHDGDGYYDEAELIDLLYSTFGTEELEPVWVAWHTINDPVKVPDLPTAREKLGFTPNTVVDDVVVAYNFPYVRPDEYGALMLGYIIWYVHTARGFLTADQFSASSAARRFATYADYTNHYMARPPGSREDLPEVISRTSILRIMPSTNVALTNLPHVPLRKSYSKTRVPESKAVLFVGGECVGCGMANATHQCSRCKSVAYCGKECQEAHWVDGGHREVCGSVKGEK